MSKRTSEIPQILNDWGFGNKLNNSGRLINTNGAFNVRRVGTSFWKLSPYQYLVTIRWSKYWVILLSYYTFANAFFALLILQFDPNGLNGLDALTSFSERFFHAFFFSVQTFTSVGYGAISPQGFVANVIASTIALAGLLSFSLMTGLFFARFSRPTSRIAFSTNAVICSHREGKALMLRMVNQRTNSLIDLQVTAIFAYFEGDGQNRTRKFVPCPLERDKLIMFPLNWTLVHYIDENSPLYNMTPPMCIDSEMEVIIKLQAFDDTFGQNIHVNASYAATSFIWGARFAPMYHIDDAKVTILDLNKLDETVVE
jgi:inward rectifier potassium channel